MKYNPEAYNKVEIAQNKGFGSLDEGADKNFSLQYETALFGGGAGTILSNNREQLDGLLNSVGDAESITETQAIDLAAEYDEVFHDLPVGIVKAVAVLMQSERKNLPQEDDLKEAA